MKSANENHSIEARHLATMLAARAMLAALKEIQTQTADLLNGGNLGPKERSAMGLFRKRTHEAIAQAEGAGIEAPANVIAASSDLAKGDAP